MEISLINVNPLHKMAFLLGFQRFSGGCCFLWGGRWEGGSGLGTRVHPWQIHVDVWQNQYNIVKVKILL